MRSERTSTGPGRRTPPLVALPAACLLALSACQPSGDGAPQGATAPPGFAQVTPATVPRLSPDGVGYLVFDAVITPGTRDLFIQDMDRLRAAGARESTLASTRPAAR